MYLNNIPILEYKKEWELTYLTEFRNDIKELKLISERDLLYEGGKYFHRARNYADKVIKDKNPRIFPVVPTEIKMTLNNRLYKNDLISYIDEYLYYKDDEEASKYVEIPPFEWMITHLGLTDTTVCPEVDLTYWMCMFIWSACYIIPREISERQKIEEVEADEEDELYYPSPTIEDVTYMEDLYYFTLYVLHNLYSG